MKRASEYPFRHRRLIGAFTVALAFAGLSGCNSLNLRSADAAPDRGADYRLQRFEEVSALRDFRACRDEGLELDRQARESGVAGRYLASARLLAGCGTVGDGGGSGASGAAEGERMQVMALSIQNFVKGGDVARAAEGLRDFQRSFPGRDLYLADGASFVETLEVLLGDGQAEGFGRFSTLNISAALREEMGRVRYWKNH